MEHSMVLTRDDLKVDTMAGLMAHLTAATSVAWKVELKEKQKVGETVDLKAAAWDLQ